MATTTAKCPVCDWEIKGKGIAVNAGGKTLSVCCDECAQKVKADPTPYLKTQS